jgi:iron only hydrogenase large subunit-like protein
MSKFSGVLTLTGLDDFITPSQQCIKPVVAMENRNNSKISIQLDEETGTYWEVHADGSRRRLQPAKISLNDCLACSGCVTTAESILIQAQSVAEFLDHLPAPTSTPTYPPTTAPIAPLSVSTTTTTTTSERPSTAVIVSVSPQTRASLAAHFGLDVHVTYRKLITLFQKCLGVRYVCDTNFARQFALLEMAREFVQRYRERRALPMLASCCPGWVCYAEKKEGAAILPLIATTKSPQQIMGSLVKYYLAPHILSLDPRAVYHTAVMPCYDKKLEASRSDFYNETLQLREVDCVLTTQEVLDIIREKQIDFVSLPETPIPSLLTCVDPTTGCLNGNSGGSGAGGYLEFLFVYAAKELFGVDVTTLDYHTPPRKRDFRELTLTVNDEAVLRFAACYGFNNIKNICKAIKQGTCKYHFVELMACPGACLNGGGQIRPPPSELPKHTLARVHTLYHQETLLPFLRPSALSSASLTSSATSASTVLRPNDEQAIGPNRMEQRPTNFPWSMVHDEVQRIYQTWFKGDVGCPLALQYFHTQYHEVPPLESSNALAIKW